MSGYGMVERTAGAVTIPIRSAKFAEFDGRGDQMACSRTGVDVGGTFKNSILWIFSVRADMS